MVVKVTFNSALPISKACTVGLSSEPIDLALVKTVLDDNQVIGSLSYKSELFHSTTKQK